MLLMAEMCEYTKVHGSVRIQRVDGMVRGSAGAAAQSTADRGWRRGLTRHLFSGAPGGPESKVPAWAGRPSPEASVPGVQVQPSRPVLSGYFL